MTPSDRHAEKTAEWDGGLERARAALYKKYRTWISGHDGAFLYEKIIQQLYMAILEPGDACIDVGANKGFHSFPMAAAVGNTGKVYAFEPISELNAALVDRARREGVGQVEFIVAALGSTTGVAEFFNIKNYTPLSGLKLRSPPADAVIEKIRVPLMRLDDRIPRDVRIRFIKIDVEGGELDVIKGSLELIKRDRPVIVFEDGRDKAAENYQYTIDDYFGVLSGAELVPLDILGARITRANWQDKQVYYTVLCPKEHLDDVSEILRLTVAEKVIGAAEAIRRARELKAAVS
ncbi:FkbM family methyltransferase [Reyranella sp. CPCC 100927]|uniref:FkbM family methyltransferase n=1 Tax=Reyranella sp. CPCC 100927 TaxID=2599616 RepID=UPI0011B695A2|nr:FkbM family methyltransferase [Reyranella sp. CPCC 100927]TWT12603.1 FkbM family methyltransferase [Reyranella sp. CPCC 100927]